MECRQRQDKRNPAGPTQQGGGRLGHGWCAGRTRRAGPNRESPQVQVSRRVADSADSKCVSRAGDRRATQAVCAESVGEGPGLGREPAAGVVCWRSQQCRWRVYPRWTSELCYALDGGRGQAARARVQRHIYAAFRSEEHTSELQSLMRISYAVFCFKKTTKYNT